MVKKVRKIRSAEQLRLKVGLACAAVLFAIMGSMANSNFDLVLDESLITFYGTEGWLYQLEGKGSLADLSWDDIGESVWGENKEVSIDLTHVDSGFFRIEATYIGGGSDFNFSQKGEHSYISAVYGSRREGYDSITSEYETLPVSGVSAFVQGARSVPLNGLLRIPDIEEGAPPSPLAIIVHGWSDVSFSEKGYLYLCEQFASHGIIAATIDESIFNEVLDADREEIDARAILLLEHVKQFGIWNETSGHPLEGKVDMENVMLIGHSRGGEAVEMASYFQSLGTNASPVGVDEELYFDGTETNSYLGPYNNFILKALVALAPTEGTGINGISVPPVEGNYLLIQGSADDDVMRFGGYNVYEQANPIDLDNPQNPADAFKAMVWIHGANHIYFNTVWSLEQEDFSAIDEDLQRKITTYYITAFACSTLFKDDQAVRVFQDNRFGDEYFVTEDESDVSVKRITQYQGRERLFINHYQEDDDLQTLSSALAGISGTNSWTDATLTETSFSSVASETSASGSGTNNFAVYCLPAMNGEYTVSLDDPLDVSMFNGFSLDIANSEMDSSGIGVVLIDADGNSVEFDTSNFASLWGPAETIDSSPYLPIVVMQTIFIPFDVLAEANGDFAVTALKLIKLKISDAPFEGGMYFDNLQFIK